MSEITTYLGSDLSSKNYIFRQQPECYDVFRTPADGNGYVVNDKLCSNAVAFQMQSPEYPVVNVDVKIDLLSLFSTYDCGDVPLDSPKDV